MSNKIQIVKNIKTLGGYELDGKIEDVIKLLQGFISDNPTYSNIELSVNTESGYYGSCSTEIEILGYRLETDEEFNYRIEAAEAAKQAEVHKKRDRERDEKTMYERLKKKYES